MKREVERPCLPICYNIVTPHYLFFLFWAAAPEGQMTYDSTQGDFLWCMSPPNQASETPNWPSWTQDQIRSGLADPKSGLADSKSGISELKSGLEDPK